MNITVYLGANTGNDPRLSEAVKELGTWIGQNGHTLIYGGSKCGLMGELAESVLNAKGKVIGVEPQFFIEAGFDYSEITQLIVTKDMTERKTKMIEGENEPIGILLCADKDNAVVEMTLGDNVKNVYASKYLTYMPSKEELLKIIRDEKELLEFSKDEFEN